MLHTLTSKSKFRNRLKMRGFFPFGKLRVRMTNKEATHPSRYNRDEWGTHF